MAQLDAPAVVEFLAQLGLQQPGPGSLVRRLAKITPNHSL